MLAALVRRADVAGALRLVVASTESEAEAFADDLEAFGVRVQRFPARERGARVSSDDARDARQRIRVVQELAGGGGRGATVVASMLALLQPIPSARELEREFLRLKVGEVLHVERLLKRLVQAGYARQPLAENPGELSLRGDILDIFPMASDTPLRIELFEDEIESLRSFDPVDQRSIESLKEVEVCLAADATGDEGSLLIELLPAGSLVVEVEPLRVAEKAEGLAVQLPAFERGLRTFKKGVTRHRLLLLQSLPGEDLSLDTRSVQGLEVGMKQAAAALAEVASDGTRVVLLCLNAAEEERLHQTLGELPGVVLRRGQVARGFRVPGWGLVIVNHHELKGVLGARRRARPHAAHKVKAIQSFFELRPGDLVVHAVHGLARYRGLEKVARGSGEEEHLHLVFADDVSLFVPSSRIDMVQRYIGPGGGTLALDKIGGTAFRKRKERVERGLFDMAADLIEVQAKRALRTRPPWRGDDELVREMVASFQHTDTVDQATSDAEIEADLFGPKPMDRMICGDVGFGKTELGGARRLPRRERGRSGGRPRAHDGARGAALQDVPRAPGRLPGRGRHRQPLRGRQGRSRAGRAARRRRHRRPGRHAPHAVQGHPLQEPGPGDHRRGAALRRRPQGALQAPAGRGRRAHHDRDADPAHAAHVARGHPRHLRPHGPAGGPAGDRDDPGVLRRRRADPRPPAPRARPGRPGLRAAQTASRPSRPSRAGCASWCRKPATPSATAR